MFAVMYNICVLRNRNKLAYASNMPGCRVIEDKTSQSLSIVSVSVFAAAHGKMEKMVNTKFIGSPWTSEGKGRRKHTQKIQFFV